MFGKLAIYVIIALLIAGAFGALYITNQKLKHDVLQISIERDNLRAAVKSKQLELDNSKHAQQALQNLLTKEKVASQKLEQELEVIRNEPETDNGDVSPILKRQLGRLRDDDKV